MRRDTPASILASLEEHARGADCRLTVTFPVKIPKNFAEDEVRAQLEAQGYARVHAERKGADGKILDVVADRFRWEGTERSRIVDALERALRVGGGRVDVHAEKSGSDPDLWRYSTDLHCAACDIHYETPHPSTFSFNSPLGACDTCRGFGRVIGVDYGLVIPDERKTLGGGAIKPFQSKSFIESQRDLEKSAAKDGIPLDVPFRDLTPRAEALGDRGRRGLEELEQELAGRLVRREAVLRVAREQGVQDAHPRAAVALPLVHAVPGLRRGAAEAGRAAVARRRRRRGASAPSKATAIAAIGRSARTGPTRSSTRSPGLSLHDLMLLPIERVKRFFDDVTLPPPLDEATEMLLDELRARLAFLVDVGLGYLTLDRQSRTLSGGEVQRINLTTALGTSLVNTLFVLDEPSIGLHPRDMHRVVQVMHRLRNAGNSLVVVEHDPQVMLAADRVIDMGPGPGERGGRIVFNGTPDELRGAETLTGRYLGGRLTVDPARPLPVPPNAPKLVLQGAREHNLKSIDVEIPLKRLVCVTGVSGSGKSTLIQDVLYPALAKAKGKATETPGDFDRLLRRGLARRRRVRRPVADRQDHAQQSGELRRRVRQHPRDLREGEDVEGAQLHRRHLLVQLGRRPLPDLRRQRLRARRDAVPVRRLPALPGLRRQALPAGDAGGDGRAARQASRTSPTCSR